MGAYAGECMHARNFIYAWIYYVLLFITKKTLQLLIYKYCILHEVNNMIYTWGEVFLVYNQYLYIQGENI